MSNAPMNAQCHCGTVKFRVTLTDGFKTARRCDCSYCRMRGAVVVSADLSDIEILEGEEALSLYQFGTQTAYTISARAAASTPTTSAARIRASTASTSPVSTGSAPSISRPSRSMTG